MDQCREEYDKWIELLKSLNHEDMLKDPYSIWLEAWNVAMLFNK